MRCSIAACVLAVVAPVVGAQAPPATDIFLAPISISAEGRPVIGKPINVTNRPGYDNQPAFTLDSKGMLFTSIHDDGQADIYRYDIGAKTVARVTSTPESEYSATIMPGGQRFSVIRVERDSSQRLWSFAFDGSDPQLVVPSVKPVGYHAWIDPDNLALFVLGNPNALVHYDLRSGHADTLARNIGRSLAPTIGGGGFSFTAHDSTGAVRLKTMSWPYQTISDLVALPRGSEDIVWLARDLVLSSDGTKLVSWKAGTKEWQDAVDLAPAGLTRISRLAVSLDGKWLAIVAVPAP
jgi:WD40-like Beta Propeller Repeat